MRSECWGALLHTNQPQPPSLPYGDLPPMTQLFKTELHIADRELRSQEDPLGYISELRRQKLGELYRMMRQCVLFPNTLNMIYHWPERVELVWDNLSRTVPMDVVHEWYEKGEL